MVARKCDNRWRNFRWWPPLRAECATRWPHFSFATFAMVLEGLVADVLEAYVGAYVDGLSGLRMGLFSGTLLLEVGQSSRHMVSPC
jgi:hypothetical protein